MVESGTIEMSKRWQRIRVKDVSSLPLRGGAKLLVTFPHKNVHICFTCSRNEPEKDIRTGNLERKIST